MNTPKLAFRNLSRQKKRSALLAGAVAFGFLIVTVVDGLSAGAIYNMANQFSDMFGGNVIVAGTVRLGEDKFADVTKDADLIEDVIKKSSIDFVSKTKRSQAGGMVIFNGKKATTNLFGCDFNAEKNLQKSLSLKEGNWKDILQSENSIILSESVVDGLKAQLGDILLFQTETVTGQKTFGEFTLLGISRDVSMLGAIAAYVNLKTLNDLIGLLPEEFSMYALMTKDPANQESAAFQIESLLREYAPVTSLVKARSEKPDNPQTSISKQIKKGEWDDFIYSVVSFNDIVPQFKSIPMIVANVSTGVLLAIMFIVMIGISNTFKMVLYERIREVGTMRAVGMKKREASSIFRWEAVLLSFIGAFCGLLVGILVMEIIGFIPVHAEALSLFVKNGHWTWKLSVSSIVWKFAVMIILTLLAVHGTAKSAAKLNPAEALRTVK